MSLSATAFATESAMQTGQILVDGVDITIDIDEEISRAKRV